MRGSAPSRRPKPKKIGASTTFTKGPARVILTSSEGFSGRDSRLETPPMGRRVMLWISMPRRCATREWPNSCSTTQMNSATITAVGVSAPARLPELWYPRKAKKARSKKKVQWTFTSIPENRPILKEPPIRNLLFVCRDQIASATESAEREAISLHPRIEKLDLKLSISDGLGLPDQLIESLFGNPAVAPLVNVGSVSTIRRLSIDEHAKRHRQTWLGRSHH